LIGRSQGAADTFRKAGLKLVAAGVLAVGGIGWVAFSISSGDSWPFTLGVAGFWAVAGLIGWYAPRVGAITLMAGAGVGFILALAVGFDRS
jgi:hypothetical protein